MSESTRVWVRTSALELAISGKRRSKSKRGLPGSASDDEGDGYIDWGWAAAEIHELKSDQPVEICVLEEDSPHQGVTVRLPQGAFEKGDLCMDNKYGSDDVMYDDDEDEDDIERYPDDLITLTHLHEPAVVHCLRKRYAYDKIYTSTGPILLALNPFKNCKHLYSEKVMRSYFERGELSMTIGEDALQKLDPHVYGIADHSFRTMMRTIEELGGSGGAPRKPLKSSSAQQKTCDQSILVSGESGAGKTVTTKFIMQYLATLSQRCHHGGKNGATGNDKSVEQQVLQSNPILESFGNARTIRNDNSSRFGKFIDMEFSTQGMLMGASIETYLLEKVRLISQAEGERNYHIFYEIFCMPEEDLPDFFLDEYTVEDFKMTNQSGTYDRRDGVEDFETYDEMRRAMETMGISEEEQRRALEIPCAALHASNISFEEKSADESALDRENPHLEPFCELMGLTAEALETAICFLKIQAGRDSHMRTLSRVKAEKGMEALIKAFYGALFTFLVRRINESITVKESSSGRSRRARSSGNAKIGVLDIFGFESFKHNSFEQLCINYCNEALQQQFNLFVLKNEQAEYEREGIEWAFISFPDNQDVLDLIDKKGSGILNILDDQCRAPGTTDKTFCIDLYKKCTSHFRFEADHRQVGAEKFAIKHYAGPVEYDTVGFVEKNRDELPKEACDLLLGSSKEIVRTLATIISDPTGNKDGAKNRGVSPARKKTKVTVGGQFSKQLHDLRSKIDLTSPHYVRCLKPNDLLIPDHFNPLIISDQLRYAGVIEAVRVSRVGYPQRYTHNAFSSRYRSLALRELKKAQRGTRRAKPVNTVVNALCPKLWQIMSDQGDIKGAKAEEAPTLVKVGIQVGKTKVFLRRKAYEILEQLRLGKMADCATSIQTVARRYIHRRDYLWICEGVLVVQTIARMKAATAQVQELRVNDRATRIQTVWRTHIAHQHYVAVSAVAEWMQRVQRGRMGRKRYDELNRERKATVIQAYWRRSSRSKAYRKMLQCALAIQCAIRCRWARTELKKLRAGARDLSNAMKERDELRREVSSMQRKMLDQLASLREAEKALSAAPSAEELEAVVNQVKELMAEVAELKASRDEALGKCQLEQARAEKAERNVSELNEQLEAESQTKQAEIDALKEDVRSAKSTNEEHKLGLEAKAVELNQLTEKLVASEVEREQLRATADSMTEEVEELNDRLDAAETDSDRLQSELNERDEEVDALNEKLVSAHTESELLRSALSEKTGEMDALKEELVAAVSECDKLKSAAEANSDAIEDLRNNVVAAKTENEQLQSTLSTTVEDNDALKKRLDAVNDESISLRSMLDAKTEEVSSMQRKMLDQLVSLREAQEALSVAPSVEELEVALNQVKELMVQVAELRTSREEALGDCEAEKARAERAEMIVSELDRQRETEKQTKQAEIDALKEEVRSVKSTNEAQKSALEVRAAEVDELSEKLVAGEADRKLLRATADAKTEEVDKLKDRLDDAETDGQRVQSELNERDEALDTLNEKLIAVHTESELLRSALSEKMGEVDALKEELVAAGSESDQLRSTAETNSQEIEDLRNKLVAADTENELLQSTLHARVEDHDALKKKLDVVIGESIELRSMLDSKTEEIDMALASADNAAEKLRATISANTEEILSLKAKLSVADSESERLRSILYSHAEEIDSKAKEIEACRAQVATAEARAGEAESKVTSSVHREEELRNQTRELTEAVTQARDEADGARESLAIAEQARAALQIELTESNCRLDTQLQQAQRDREKTRELLAKSTADNDTLAKELDRVRDELDELRKRENHSVESTVVTETTVSSEELEEAKKTIERLEKELEAANAPDHPYDAVRKKYDDLKAKYKKDIGKAEARIEDLGQRLADAKDAVCRERRALSPEELDDWAAEEILQLQDEVNRLNKELTQSRTTNSCGASACSSVDDGDEDLIKRYSELTKLANACVEKDREIDHLKLIIAELENAQDGPMPRELVNNEESDHLKLYINELQKEIGVLRLELDDSREREAREPTGGILGKGRGFMGRNKRSEEESSKLSATHSASVSDASETIQDLEAEVEALKEVNEMLRKDVEKSHKTIRTIEKELEEERERSRKELEAFSKTLRGVDDLRMAAESMSREVTRYKKKPKQKPQTGSSAPLDRGFLSADEAFTDDDFTDDQSHIRLADAKNVIDKAKHDFDRTRKVRTKQAAPPFWNLAFQKDSSAMENEHDAEQMLTAITMEKKRSRRRQRQQRRGSGSGTVVSSFF